MLKNARKSKFTFLPSNFLSTSGYFSYENSNYSKDVRESPVKVI